ncbi:hypothetical protein AVEN_183713-1 [Araneus ventricosus]|uniref:Uncharacterized protein n=1 Tax=Araneus ventricosus TaxID=182803 RepID=A0A4Y2MJS0_ARAVE|nr:hypothetical protein AVEN_183713-1 [Araneus ventricosus]
MPNRRRSQSSNGNQGRIQHNETPYNQQRSFSAKGQSKPIEPVSPACKDIPSASTFSHGDTFSSTNSESSSSQTSVQPNPGTLHLKNFQNPSSSSTKNESTPSRTPVQLHPETMKPKSIQTQSPSSADNDSTIIYFSTPLLEESHPSLKDSCLAEQSHLPADDNIKIQDLEIVYS